MDDIKLGELSAKSEAIQRELIEFKQDTHAELELLNRRLTSVAKELRELRLILSKWKGFVGGIVAVVSLLWAVGVILTKYATGRGDTTPFL